MRRGASTEPMASASSQSFGHPGLLSSDSSQSSGPPKFVFVGHPSGTTVSHSRGLSCTLSLNDSNGDDYDVDLPGNPFVDVTPPPSLSPLRRQEDYSEGSRVLLEMPELGGEEFSGVVDEEVVSGNAR